MKPQEAPPDVKARLKASYDAMAPAYNAWTVSHTPLRLTYLDKLCSYVPKLTAPDQQPAILELGCGAGVPVLSTMLSRNPSLTATANDMSTTQVDLARGNLAAHADRVRFAPGDMTTAVDDLLAPGSLSAVVALYSIIHLEQEEQRKMVARVAGWLEDGGCLLANFAVEETKGVVMEEWIDEKGWMFWSGLGVEGSVKMVEDAGLKVEVQVVEKGDDETFLWIIAKKC